jgi:hypothetical protein
MRIFSKLLGLKQSINDKFTLGRKLLHSFNNSMGAKGIRGLNNFMDKYSIIENVASNIPFVQYIPKGIRLAGQAVQKAEQLEAMGDKVTAFTGMGDYNRRPQNGNLQG